MVLAWTIADTRYRFRIKTAPIPLEKITFWVVSTVGILTILTDLWRANGWPVIKGGIITPSTWQALLAIVYFLTFLAWVWFAFVKPSRYGKTTCEKYATTLYEYILKGSKNELAIVADELERSANNIIFYATNFNIQIEAGDKKTHNIEKLANSILNLISDKRFCRAVVESSQNFALTLFIAVEYNEKYEVDLGVFSKNVLYEAIKYQDSFLYHESDYYESGFVGEFKPLSKVFVGNIKLIEGLRVTFDVGYKLRETWTVAEFEAYVRAASMYVENFIKVSISNHSFILARVIIIIAECSSVLYQINGTEHSWETEQVRKLGVLINFFKSSVLKLDEMKEPFYHVLRFRKEDTLECYCIYDNFADAIYEIIHSASYVNNPWWDCWSIHHNIVYDSFFRAGGESSKIIQHKLRRRIYDEIVKMNQFPNFQGARVLGYCLFVLGFDVKSSERNKSVYALHVAVLKWVRKNFKSLYVRKKNVADACLFTSLSYDKDKNRLVQIYEARGLRQHDEYRYFELDD